jgi:betaine-aldehyde dehydrogenase
MMTTSPADTALRSPLMSIGGRWTAAVSGRTLPVIDPSTEDTIGHIPAGDRSDVAGAVEAAEEAGRRWRSTTWKDRAKVLDTLADRIDDCREELAQLDALDSGNPVTGMRGDVRKAAEDLRYFAGLGGELKGETVPWTDVQFGQTFREPYGVVGRITAYNHPLMFAVSKSAAALMAGNSIVVKPSEHTSLSTLRFAEIAEDVLPPGVFNVVTGLGHEAGAALVEHPDVPRVAFTGGVPTGRAILRSGAEFIKHVTVELGGKNPMIVFPDADLRAAAAAAVTAMNLRRSMGQSCRSTSRLMPHASIAGEFTDFLVEQVESLRIGDPRQDDVDMGPLAFAAHYEKVMGYIEVGRSEGARVVTGGGRPAGLQQGYYVAPTVFADVQPTMRIATEEIFGPVICVMPWDDYDAMIEVANGVEYGLTANIWTNDLSAAYRTAQQVQAGMIWINGDGSGPPGVPFGGYKQSGLGKESGLSEMYGYTREKSLIVNLPGSAAGSAGQVRR